MVFHYVTVHHSKLGILFLYGATDILFVLPAYTKYINKTMSWDLKIRLVIVAESFDVSWVVVNSIREQSEAIKSLLQLASPLIAPD